MAENDNIELSKTKSSDAKKESDTKTQQQVPRAVNNNTLAWILGGLALFVFVGLFISAIGMFAYNHHNKRVGYGLYGAPMMEGRGRGLGGPRSGNMMYRDDIRGFNNESVIFGVVTAVNGDSFTIAGGGTTNSVKTNSSTQYIGASKASINDTVSAVGTNSNNAFIATKVIIRN